MYIFIYLFILQILLHITLGADVTHRLIQLLFQDWLMFSTYERCDDKPK